MAEDSVDSTRVRIIKAAESVVRTQGVARLTLNEVAQAAGVSKGGLLYHFPSKDALIQGMLAYALEVFENAIAQYCETDKAPGAWLRGYILATFSGPGTEVHEESLTSAAIIASVSNNPSLLAPYQAAIDRWESKAAAEAMDPVAARLIRLAVDGLWLHEGIGLRPVSASARREFLERLIEWTRALNA